jgi:hypothetical protein
MEIRRILGQLAKNQGAISTTKAKVVFNGMVNLHIPGCISTVIQITFRVLIEDIDRWWGLLVMKRQNSENRLQASSASQKVPSHRLG